MKGDLQQYELLKHQLSDPDIKVNTTCVNHILLTFVIGAVSPGFKQPILQDGQIINWLQEFRSCVTLLGKDHEHLIHTILVSIYLGNHFLNSCEIIPIFYNMMFLLIQFHQPFLFKPAKQYITNSYFHPPCLDYCKVTPFSLALTKLI